MKLSVTQKDIPYEIKKLITVYPTKAPSVVMRKTDKTVVRQRIINGRLEQVSQATSKDVYAIEQTTDTVVTFNGETFYASQMSTRIAHFANLHVQHMQLDAMAQKWYITTSDGLFVANIDSTTLIGDLSRIVHHSPDTLVQQIGAPQTQRTQNLCVVGRSYN